MAKFFKYKSAAELEAENARLGTDLRFTDDLSPMWRPIQVGPRTAGNRWCVHPMEGCDGELDGSPGELTFRRYVRFGAGGAKLLWGEACAVTNESRATPRQVTLNEKTKAGFARIVADCRKAHRDANGDDSDLLFGLQLTHSGRYSHPRPIIATHDPILDPRTVADKATGAKVTPDYPLISDDELKRLVDDYARVAKLAVEVGFDFIDVKQCHRYLLNELLGARNRPGPYGGSYENRTRFAREAIQAVRAAVPASVVIATRMNVYDGIPFHKPGEPGASAPGVLNSSKTPGADAPGSPGASGVPDAHALPLVNGWGMSESDPFAVDLTEPLKWIGEMRALGVTLVNATMGNPYAQPHYGRPFEYPPLDGYESPEHPLVGVDRHFRATEAIQRAFPDLALVGTGYSYLQEFMPQAAAANVRDGRVNVVGVGRATLSQPDWVRQLLDRGKLDRKRVCRTFSYCTALMRSKQHPMGQFPAGCPPFDKDAYGEIWKDAQQLNVKKE